MVCLSGDGDQAGRLVETFVFVAPLPGEGARERNPACRNYPIATGYLRECSEHRTARDRVPQLFETPLGLREVDLSV